MTNAHVLNQLKAKSLGPGKHFDGQGLMLVKHRKDAGKWILRVVVGGKRREMGLGRWPDVSIAEARDLAFEARKMARDGVDPIEKRDGERKKSNRLTVAEAIEACFRAKQAELKGDGKSGRWMSPLSVHVVPKIGTMAIEDVDQHTLRQILEPIWQTKSDTARKALNRISLTLKHSAALGLDVDLQAPLKAQALLGKRRHKTVHIPSLPYVDAPDFYRWLCSKEYISAFALRFLILTVARTSEVRFAANPEISEGVWSLDASRTKTGTEHRIPLSTEARNVLATRPILQGTELLFPTARGRPMSDATMSRLMEREGFQARPHGFRSTFRTWVEERTDAAFEVKEISLGHRVGTDVERAYQRSDLLQQRQTLLEAWGAFLLGAAK